MCQDTQKYCRTHFVEDIRSVSLLCMSKGLEMSQTRQLGTTERLLTKFYWYLSYMCYIYNTSFWLTLKNTLSVFTEFLLMIYEKNSVIKLPVFF